MLSVWAVTTRWRAWPYHSAFGEYDNTITVYGRQSFTSSLMVGSALLVSSVLLNCQAQHNWACHTGFFSQTSNLTWKQCQYSKSNVEIEDLSTLETLFTYTMMLAVMQGLFFLALGLGAFILDIQFSKQLVSRSSQRHHPMIANIIYGQNAVPFYFEQHLWNTLE